MERTSAVADTGFVVALLNRLDTMHSSVTPVYTQQKQILLPQTVLAEVAYLVGRNAGSATLVAFLKGLSASRFILVHLTDQDVIRVAEILDEYADSRIDFVDASVMAIAERYAIKTILTLDQRDFRLFRPNYCDCFEILP
ncbi:type II toxin-antitoxin system VapC family toxin [Cylindrospermum sp. FACHB-282]|uniref:type II toxin-antitoxin system VapC family toxin n=1 Tax=Cylindrospermum sp. FACHB-282 TaxID=2692794 RepID=UPI0016882C45|nr:PIN domain-containing protein [Cylindrospermum sp. FACHB-282]MBD2386961.1 PIN domain-containing protein [Cylindrospermum sp. FACHB-282]